MYVYIVTAFPAGHHNIFSHDRFNYICSQLKIMDTNFFLYQAGCK